MAFYNIDNQVKRRRMELAEKEQRLANDPGHIFMKSLASSAPKQLLSALGTVGVNLAKAGADYSLFGGKEERESVIKARDMKNKERLAMIAERNPALRGKIYEDEFGYKRDLPVSKPSEGAMDLVKTAEDVLSPADSLDDILKVPEKEPTKLDKILSAEPEIKDPETIYMGDGEYAVEVPVTGMTPEQMRRQGLITDPTGESSGFTPGGKAYKVMSTEQMVQYKDSMREKERQRRAAEKQPSAVERILSPELPDPAELKQPAAAPAAVASPVAPAAPEGARQQAPVETAQVEATAFDAYGNPLTSAELRKEAELRSLERRKNADLTQSQRKKRQDLIKSQLAEELKQAHNFMALTSAEELALGRADLQARYDRERDPIVREVLGNALAAYPSESERQRTETMFKNNKGTVRVGSVSIGEKNKITFNYREKPKRTSNLDAMKRNQSQITRNERTIEDPLATPEEREKARQDNVRLRASNKELGKATDISQKVPTDDDGNLTLLAGEETTIGSPSAALTSQRRQKKMDVYKSNRDGINAKIVGSKSANQAFTKAYNGYIESGQTQEDATALAVATVIDDKGELQSQYKPKTTGKDDAAKAAYPFLFNFSTKTGVPKMVNKTINESLLTVPELNSLNAYAQDKSAEEVSKIMQGAIRLVPVKGAKKNRVQQVIDSE